MKDQKVHIGEAIKNHHLFNKVVKEQLDLQRARVMSTQRLPDGRVVSDLFIPRDAVSRTQMARAQLGLFNETLRSVSENTVKWGKNTQWAGRQLMVGFTFPIGLAAAAAGKLAYDMDKSLTQITKVYGDATKEFQDTTEQIRAASMETAKNMANLYGQSAKDTLEITAQFAAAGATGMELQQATAAATKARMLNEIDLQTAIEASITMQTVYGYSAEELAQKWDYINAVSNQTILSAEDFATAIPKVAGVLKELGGDIEDVGMLMTAMKAAGIDAAEGANALKTISFRSISAYGKGLETFKAKTGQDLKAIVADTNGEVIPTLDRMWAAMQGLSVPDKIAVVKDVFGIYQGNKALNLLTQMAEKSGQVAQAIAVGENSIADNAAIANQELARMNERPFKKLQKAVEGIKIAMAEVGEAVLPLVVTLVEGIQGILEWVSGLDNTKKVALTLGLAIFALIGPITMLTGLFANMLGTLGKAGTIIGSLITRFKVLTPEQRTQELLAKQAANAFDTQTGAAARLTIQLQNLTAAMERSISTQARSAVVARKQMSVQDKIIRRNEYLARAQGNTAIGPAPFNRDAYRWNAQGTPQASAATGRIVGRAERGAAMQAMRFEARREGARQASLAARARTSNAKELARVQQVVNERNEKAAAITAKQNALLEQQRAKYNAVAVGAAGAAATVGMLGMMFAPSGGFAQGASQVLFTLGMIGTLMPGLIAKTAVWVKTMAVGALGAVRGLTGLRAAAIAFGTAMKAAALPLTILAAAIGMVWYKASQDAQAAADKIEALGKSTKTWAELLGYNEQTTGDLVKDRAKTGQEAVKGLADTFREMNAEAAAAFDDRSGLAYGEKWAIAINEGVKVKLTGGTADAAKQATRVALELMDETFSDAAFEVQVNARVNFNDPSQITGAAVEGVTQQMNEAKRDMGAGWERFFRDWTGMINDNDVSEAGKKMAENAGAQFAKAYLQTDARYRDGMLQKLADEQQAGLLEAYKQVADEMSFEEFYKMLVDGANDKSGLATFTLQDNFSEDVLSQLEKDADAMNIVAEKIATSLNIDSKVRDKNGVITWQALSAYLDKANGELLAAGNAAGGAATEVDKAAEATDDLNDAMKRLNIGAADSETMLNEWKSIMTGTQDAMFDFAESAWDNHADNVMAGLDREADRAEEAFDKRRDAMDARHDAAQDRLQKKQEARQKAVESQYDKRIEKIQAAIDAEKKANDERQKIFEAEQRRMQRYSTMFSNNVDLNAAIATGNLDEAAKIANNMQSQQDTWNMEDSNMAAQAASDKRTAALEAQKSRIEKERDARLEALKAVEEAENKALEARQRNEQRALDASIAAEKRLLDEKRRNRQRDLEEDKRLLDIKLATIRAYIPRNMAEMEAQQRQIEAAYKQFGVTFEGKGKEWSKYIGDAFTENTKQASGRIKTEINWKAVGSDIADMLLKGGFGMSAAEFAKWMNGGEAPPNTLFSSQQYKSTGGGTKANDKRHSHTGSIAGVTQGKRTGWSGKHNSQSEIDVTVLKGQGILTRKATDFIGEENIRNLNAGKLPPNTGPWNMAGAGAAGLAAAAVAGATKRVMSNTLNAIKAMGPGAAASVLGAGPTFFGDGGWARPAAGRVTSEYGMRVNPVTGVYKLHGGIDIGAPTGAPIFASRKGMVTMADYYPSLGNYVRIDHGGGIQTGYAHQSRIMSQVGQNVRAGQRIGLVGTTGNSTGPHLHFEYWKGGQRRNPREIIPKFAEGGYTLSSGLAELHPKETILSRPLSEDLKNGLRNFANDGGSRYDVTIDMRGSKIASDVDVEKAVNSALDKRERRLGRSRRLGDEK